MKWLITLYLSRRVGCRVGLPNDLTWRWSWTWIMELSNQKDISFEEKVSSYETWHLFRAFLQQRKTTTLAETETETWVATKIFGSFEFPDQSFREKSPNFFLPENQNLGGKRIRWFSDFFVFLDRHWNRFCFRKKTISFLFPKMLGSVFHQKCWFESKVSTFYLDLGSFG